MKYSQKVVFLFNILTGRYEFTLPNKDPNLNGAYFVLDGDTKKVHIKQIYLYKNLF